MCLIYFDELSKKICYEIDQIINSDSYSPKIFLKLKKEYLNSLVCMLCLDENYQHNEELFKQITEKLKRFIVFRKCNFGLISYPGIDFYLGRNANDSLRVAYHLFVDYDDLIRANLPNLLIILGIIWKHLNALKA